MTAHPNRRRWRRTIALVAALVATVTLTPASAHPAFAAGAAPGGPGAAGDEDGSAKQAFAGSTSPNSKIWWDLGSGELQEVFYPQLDTPDTAGLQYIVTDGSSFAETETTGTTHAATPADPTSLTWTQTNTADNGDYTITKTYVSDPGRAVLLIETTVKNTSSKTLGLYAQYDPALDNELMGNTGGYDATSGDLVAQNGAYASALSSSVGFLANNTGYAGTASDGQAEVTGGYALSTGYGSAATAGHISQTAEVETVAAGTSGSFTLALAFDTSEGSAISDAAASLATGFASLESTFESGWHGWVSGLTAPASVTGNAKLEQQYYVSLEELKADEDKTYTGAFVASPTNPWGTSVSWDGTGDHGYHLVWTRDEYEIAGTLAVAGDTTDARAALTYLLRYEVTSNGWVKQNTWLNGTQVWSGTQMDQVADPILLAYQLGVTDATTWATLKTEAGYLVSNGPWTGEERWEENSGYSPSTMAAEIAGLVAAASIATANGDTSDAATYLSTADAFKADLSYAYTTAGSYSPNSYYMRLGESTNPNDGSSINIANGGGGHPDEDIVDEGFQELVRLGIDNYGNSAITGSITAVDSQIKQTIAGYGTYFYRYNHDGYGETSSGGDYTGTGVGRLWPVLSGERGEYDVAAGDTAGAQSMLTSLADAANPSYQISEQIWNTTGAGGFTEGRPDNSATPLMWAMAQYVRLALDISAGRLLEQPAAVCARYDCTGASTGGAYKQVVNVNVPVDTDASGDTVYLAGDLSALGGGQSDWAADGIAMTRVNATEWTTTISAATSGAALSYKFDLGGSWPNVEKSASCADISNRALTVSGGTTSAQVAGNWVFSTAGGFSTTDTVAAWQGVGSC